MFGSLRYKEHMAWLHPFTIYLMDMLWIYQDSPPHPKPTEIRYPLTKALLQYSEHSRLLLNINDQLSD